MIKSFIDKYNYEYYTDVNLKKYNSYKLEVIARYLIFPKSIFELKKIIKFIRDNDIKYMILGNGSNIIFSNDYYDGIIIRLDRFDELKINNNKVVVGAGYSLVKLSIEMANKGLSGLEFAAGIPGFVGASVAMNAGAYNHSLSEIVKSVKVLNPDNKVEIIKGDKLGFGYRDSFFKKNKDYIILSCELVFSYGDKKEIMDIINKRKQRRLDSQPLEYPSAGSVFRNPEGMFAGKLIEDVGLKGYKSGGAMVSLKHANFIINYDKATGKDIILLIDKIKKEVKDRFDVDLVLEQIIVD